MTSQRKNEYPIIMFFVPISHVKMGLVTVADVSIWIMWDVKH